MTYVALANTTLSSSAASVSFSSIPNSFRDLVLVIQVNGLGGDPSSRGSYLVLNSTEGTSVTMYGASGAQVSGNENSVILPFGNYRNYSIINIMDYSATDKHKTILQRAGSPVNVEWAVAGRVAITSAVTSITLWSPDNGSDVWISGTTFALYGIAA